MSMSMFIFVQSTDAYSNIRKCLSDTGKAASNSDERKGKDQ